MSQRQKFDTLLSEIEKAKAFEHLTMDLVVRRALVNVAELFLARLDEVSRLGNALREEVVSDDAEVRMRY